MKWKKTMKIKNLETSNDVFLAPLAGVSDVTFRTICKEFGVGLTVTEMISAKGLMYDNKNTSELLKKAEIEKPIAIQLFGSDPDIIAGEAKKIEDQFDMIDLNMGCPVPKIVKNGEGSALMLNEQLAYDIVKKLTDTVSIPVSVKFRKGFDDNNINAVNFAKKMEKAGASMVTVHGRTRQQFYSGTADWDIIRQVKENVQIPVVGNGDILTRQAAKDIREITKCDGIMLARGVLGNPWLIQEILEDRDILVTPVMRKEMALRHTKMLIEELGEERAMVEIRKHVIWYIKGMPNSARIRDQIGKITTLAELINVLDANIK